MRSSECPCHLLLIEDNDDEALLLERAASKVSPRVTMVRCRDVAEGITYLNGESQFSDRQRFPYPELVITDLKLGLESGFDFVRWIRSHDIFAAIPVVLMSGSRVPDTVRRAYSLGANAVLTKPVEYARMIEYMETLVAFWCGIVERPEPFTSESRAN